ncbi:hypothetical protein D9756_004948 [Leucocoprinus leucothites]|uniref:Alpha/beta-hydrolase n=1 Tax=Leucocoprinus leucothites TaxID=201217 RepID=A0A8H5G9G2_9AGAR|nr:hypothetical protein D9756_004948 [Leucoagaricus leucothites]
MNNVYVPTQVVVLLRRLANAVGAFGISNQYLLHRQAKADEQLRKGPDVILRTANPKGMAQQTLDGLKAVEWPSWPSRNDWRHARSIIVDKWTTVSRDARIGMYEGLLRADALSIPWLGRTISWSSVPSLQMNLNPNDPQDDPPPSPNRRPDRKQDQDPFKVLPSHEKKLAQLPPDIIHQLLTSPTLFEPLRKPRFPIVLCHGLYGFDTRGPASFPSIRVHYWSNILKILRDKVGAEVIVTSVPGTGSIASRAARLDEQLSVKARGRGINLLAHSMGGLDSRYLITHLRPTEYTPLSLTSVSTPHRGSPFMDWCAENIGIGKLNKQERELAKALENDIMHDSVIPPPNNANPKPESTSFSLSLSALPSSFTTLLLSVVDSPAYSNLTTAYLNNVFNPATPNDPKVKYFSVASRLSGVSIWHPLWLPKVILDETEIKQRLKLKQLWEQHRKDRGLEDDEESDEGVPLWAQEREWGNDGLVSVQSAKWGEFLGIMEGCDHWEMRGARGLDIDLPSLDNLNFGLSSGSGAWSILDWSRFVSAWKQEERIERNAKLQAAAASNSPAPPTPKPAQRSAPSDQPNVDEDHILKASTDRLSTVFDWLVDQIPASAKSISTSSSPTSAANAPVKAPERVVEAANGIMDELKQKAQARTQEQEEANGTVNKKMNELESKEDLERFYVALSRKIYNEGF